MKTTLFFLFAGLIFISSCKKDPRACASSDKTSALTGESVTFTNCSENALRISWDFGDGNTEEGNSVSHSYSKAGSYLISMTAYSQKDKDWDKTTMLIIVSSPPVAPLTVNTIKVDASAAGICDGNAEATANGGLPPYSFLWSNGQTTANITGLCTGIYFVTVTSSNNSSATSSISITSPPPPAKRYLTKIVLKNFAAQNPSNADWDSGLELLGTGPEPDVYVKFGLSTGEWSVSTSTITDAKSTDVPKTWTYTPQNIYLSSNNWDVVMNESDALGSEEMQKWTINPATQTANNGVISLTSASNSLDIYFEER